MSENQAPPRPWRTEGLSDSPGQSPRRPRWWVVAAWFVGGYLLIFAVLSAQDALGGPTTIPYTDFSRQVERGNVSEIFAKGNTIEGTLRQEASLDGEDEATYREFITERPTFAEDDLLRQLQDKGADVRATPIVEERGFLTNLLLSFGPLLLIFGLYWWMLRRMRSGAGMVPGFGGRKKKGPVDPSEVRTTFDDVAGIDEVKAEIHEIVDFLKNPEKYRRLGGKMPRGVMLTGPPGTGKTLLARATAGEAGVPFFSASGSEFIEMIVGVGAGRVRELFEEARKVAPSIIFIDEIDTIGRARGGTRSIGGHDEREQTLNQILTEMDGFSGSEGVVVLAATNRPDVLDPALMRPGRFDRNIHISPPDQPGRVAILEVHTRGVPLAPDADLDAISRMTPGMTGADLANLVNEAALLAARTGLSTVGAAQFSEALEKVQLGTARHVVMPEDQRRRTAYHEAGHALTAMLTPGSDPVRKVSIIPRGKSLGVTLATPDADRYTYDRDQLLGRIVTALGGMAAEQEVFGIVTTGAESDLETATAIARQMVGRWGMSAQIGPVTVLPVEGDPRMIGVSEDLLGSVDAEIRGIIEEAYATARGLLVDNRAALDALAGELLEHETLAETAVYAAAGILRSPAEVG